MLAPAAKYSYATASNVGNGTCRFSNLMTDDAATASYKIETAGCESFELLEERA